MPPMCEPCNRQFRNKEAAKQHLQSSGSNHPFCDRPRCDGRRFLSEQARDAHMADKHPPTFDCESCSRSFASPSALDDHYRGSPNHPNCAKCGMGFVDGKARDEHHHSAHPRVSCLLCGGVVIYKDALESHYLGTAKHPKCVTCNLGFKDAAAYEEHQKSAHPKPECTSCEREFPNNETLQRHYYVSPSHPECPLCQIGFKDNVGYQEHLESHPAFPTASQQQPATTPPGTSYGLLPLSPTPMNFTNLPQAGDYHGRMASSPVLTLQTNPLSPTMSIWTPDISPAVPLPPPGRDPKFEAAWGARANIPIQATTPRTRPTPGDGPDGAFMQAALSPTRSQGSNGNNNIQESVYSSPGMRAISHTPSANFNPFNKSVDGDIGQKEVTPHPPFFEWRGVRTLQRPPGVIQIPEAQAARQASTAIKYGLYQGNSVGSFPHRLAGTSIPPQLIGPSATSSGSHRDVPAGVPRAPLKSLATPGPRQPVVDWVELIGEKDCSVERAQSSRSDDVSSTQAVATPISSQATALAGPSSYGESPVSAGSEKFPAGTFSPWNETHLNIPLPPSASHSRSGSSPPSIKFTPFSPSNSQPQSPEVTSPIGLAALPAISPLASTPVDAFFGTATRDDAPSLTSTVPFSPFHLAIDTRLPESPSVASLASVSHSGSPRGPGAGSLNVDILSLPLPDSPSVSELASPASNVGMTPLLTSTSHMFDVERDAHDPHPTADFMPVVEKEGDADAAEAVTLHEEERDEYSAPSVAETSRTVVEEPAKSLLRVYCRMCPADPCVEPTATLCGHLFCYRCISEYILQDPHCPVCSRAMMLNCLLTLHLSE